MPAAARDYGRRLRCARRLLNGTLFASLRSATHSLRTTAHCLATLGHLPRYARLPPRFARQLVASVTAHCLATLGHLPRCARLPPRFARQLIASVTAHCLATLGYLLASLGIIGLASLDSSLPRYARPPASLRSAIPSLLSAAHCLCDCSERPRYARPLGLHPRYARLSPRFATLGYPLASLGSSLPL